MLELFIKFKFNFCLNDKQIYVIKTPSDHIQGLYGKSFHFNEFPIYDDFYFPEPNRS